MKINRNETHDRYEHFIENQSAAITQGCEDCLKKNPLSLRLQDKADYIYIFAHPRTDEDGVTKRMLWQPRLTKPKAQTNSYLFRAASHSDIIEIIWMLPPRELWAQYAIGNVTESQMILDFIQMFQFQREKLEMPDKNDISEEKSKNIYLEIAREMEAEKRYNDLMKRSFEESVDEKFMPAD